MKKRTLAVIAAVGLVFSIFSMVGCGNSGTDYVEAPQDKSEYVKCDSNDLLYTFDENPMQAEKEYNGKFIHMNCSFVSGDPDDGTFNAGAMYNKEDYSDSKSERLIVCETQDEDQIDYVSDLSKEDSLLVEGKVTDVDKNFGYTIVVTKVGGIDKKMDQEGSVARSVANALRDD